MAKKIVLGFGIAIVFAALVHYGICTFFPEPKWRGHQVKNYREKHQRVSDEKKVTLKIEKIRKNELYKIERRKWKTLYFYIGLPIGILAVLIGAVVKLPAIGSGLFAGGIIVLINSYSHYWGQMTDLPKFITLCIIFGLLMWIGYRKIEGKKK